MNKISETAYLVAMYRAFESERPDALFRDPWARLLAGSKGLILAEMLGAKKQAANIIATRTYLMDQTIEQLIKTEKIDTVINLGAGLDTRPYRLSLPPSLQWIEVDLAEILIEKENQLRGQKPLCQLKRIQLDLANIESRRALFTEISASSNENVLVVSEGLLSYLPEEQVDILTKDLFRQKNFRWWLFELISASGMKKTPLQGREKLFHQYFSDSNSSVFLFNPAQGLDFFQQRNWKIVRFYSVWKESRRLKRGLKFAALLELLLPCFARKYWQALNRQVGVTLLERDR